MATYQIVRAPRATTSTSLKQKLSMAAGSSYRVTPRLNSGGSLSRQPFVDPDTETVHTSSDGIHYRRDQRNISLVVVRAFDTRYGERIRTAG